MKTDTQILEKPPLPISAVVPTRNRAEAFARMLATLGDGDIPAQFIVVDASSDESTEQLMSAFAQTVKARGCSVIWQRAVERGAAVQRNQGVKLADQPVVAFFDDDILLEAGCLRRLWDALQSDPMLGGVSAMITNQRYQSPGRVSRTMFRLMAGCSRQSYAGQFLGPAINLLPEDRDDLPEIVPVEWLNLGATLYRMEALPSPPFQRHFKGYSMLEDVTLSVSVGRKWKLANVRTARIYHDSQPGEHKSDATAVACMELVNRHYVMTQVLGRRRVRDYAKLTLWEFFQLAVCAFQKRLGREFWKRLNGKLRALSTILLSVPREGL